MNKLLKNVDSRILYFKNQFRIFIVLLNISQFRRRFSFHLARKMEIFPPIRDFLRKIGILHQRDDHFSNIYLTISSIIFFVDIFGFSAFSLANFQNQKMFENIFIIGTWSEVISLFITLMVLASERRPISLLVDDLQQIVSTSIFSNAIIFALVLCFVVIKICAFSRPRIFQ